MEHSLSPSRLLAKAAVRVRGIWRNCHPHTKGRWAEKLALVVLLAKGYRPFPRPWREGVQTDLLLHRNGTLVLVEVKARGSREQAFTALTHTQKQRLVHQAGVLAARHPCMAVRIDLVLVFPHLPFILHLPDQL